MPLRALPRYAGRPARGARRRGRPPARPDRRGSRRGRSRIGGVDVGAPQPPGRVAVGRAGDLEDAADVAGQLRAVVAAAGLDDAARGHRRRRRAVGRPPPDRSRPAAAAPSGAAVQRGRRNRPWTRAARRRGDASRGPPALNRPRVYRERPVLWCRRRMFAEIVTLAAVVAQVAAPAAPPGPGHQGPQDAHPGRRAQVRRDGHRDHAVGVDRRRATAPSAPSRAGYDEIRRIEILMTDWERPGEPRERRRPHQQGGRQGGGRASAPRRSR